MFSLFGKKEAKTKIIDRVFISSLAKETALLEKVNDGIGTIIIVWFEESFDRIKSLLSSKCISADVYMAREIAAHYIQNKFVLFFEHYPLFTKENELLEKLQLVEAIFYSALDEPFFSYFGGEKMISLMEKMGLSENEAVEHSMISSAIKNVQEKISRGIVIEHSATSQAEWFSKNIVK